MEEAGRVQFVQSLHMIQQRGMVEEKRNEKKGWARAVKKEQPSGFRHQEKKKKNVEWHINTPHASHRRTHSLGKSECAHARRGETLAGH
jgi:hypothetical protein